MAFGKSPRMDSRRSSSSSSGCSTATLVVFVALCLVGVWMMTSTTVVPVEMSSPDNKSEVKDQASEGESKPFEDSSGDVPDNAKGTDSDSAANAATEESNSGPEKTAENTAEKSQVDEPAKSNEEVVSDADGNVNGGETKDGEEANPEGGNGNTGNQAEDQEKTTQNKSGGTDNLVQEKSTEHDSDETANTEQDKNSEQSSKDSGNEEQQVPDKKSDEDERSDAVKDEQKQGQLEEIAAKEKDKEAEQSSDETKAGDQTTEQRSNEVFPDGAQSELLNETNPQVGAWSTQATESKNEKEMQSSSPSKGEAAGYSWKLCNNPAGTDYIPCLDNVAAIKKLRTTKHYEHRERHCPEENPTCLVPLPEGYKRPIEWPNSRDKIWYHNVPHTKLAEVKGHQNWVKVSGEYLTFPGGGTQFTHGALHYIDFIQETLSDIAWGKRTRVILDVGCGVASFGGFLFDRDVLTMSFAPKDEHEAQVQFALERGIPAISAVMGTMRLPFPGRVFDAVHCARCRVPWHIEGGKLLLELNRLLRPGGYFIWSATPVYQKLEEDVEIWEAMSALTKSMCWEMVAKTKDSINKVGLAIYRKPSDNDCYDKRTESNPPVCQESDDPNAAWNVPLQACMHKLPVDSGLRGSQWPEQWPQRAEETPYWLNSSQVGVYGKPAPQDFEADYKHWKHVVSTSYLKGMGINWSSVRNVMDMRSVYGGFAAALRDMKVWVMNIVPIDSPDTLPIIYERGFFGMYHDWCESFSTYPRTYDLLHADHLFSKLKKRCKLLGVIAEVDRMLRPEGKLIVRDSVETISEVENIAKSLKWEIRLTYSKEKEGLLCVQKTAWRPKEVEESTVS